MNAGKIVIVLKAAVLNERNTSKQTVDYVCGSMFVGMDIHKNYRQIAVPDENEKRNKYK